MSIEVKIYKDSECVYAYDSPSANENRLDSLIVNLKDVQSKINDFLTTLVEEGNDVNIHNERDVSTSDLDSGDEEVKTSPKKCKLNEECTLRKG